MTAIRVRYRRTRRAASHGSAALRTAASTTRWSGATRAIRRCVGGLWPDRCADSGDQCRGRSADPRTTSSDLPSLFEPVRHIDHGRWLALEAVTWPSGTRPTTSKRWEGSPRAKIRPTRSRRAERVRGPSRNHRRRHRAIAIRGFEAPALQQRHPDGLKYSVHKAVVRWRIDVAGAFGADDLVHPCFAG
jgi:hypothetical protein